MARVVVVFESRYGQADKIAQHIAALARKKGHTAQAVRASLATRPTVADADGVVVVAPVYFGQHTIEIERFLRSYGAIISAHPSAFVSVSSSAASASAEVRANAVQIAHRAVDDAALRPHAVVTVGGALAYPRYGFFLRLVMRRIAHRAGLPTAPSKIYELTDWAALDDGLEPFFAAHALEDRAHADAEASGVRPIPSAARVEQATR